MSSLTTSVSKITWALVAALALLTPVVVTASPAQAAASVSRAEVDRGSLRIEGRAVANRSITVDGVAMVTSGRSGSFTVFRRSYTPPADCTVDVNDGSATAASARLSGCTVTSAPPPPTSPTILPDVAQLGLGYVGADFNPGSQMTVDFTQGAVGPVRWEVVAGALPDGLAIVVPEPGGRPSPIEDDTYMQIEGTPDQGADQHFHPARDRCHRRDRDAHLHDHHQPGDGSGHHAAVVVTPHAG